MSELTSDQEILSALGLLERRFREEHHRHRATIVELRRELHDLVRRGDHAEISRAAMSDAMHISRDRLKRLLGKPD